MRFGVHMPQKGGFEANVKRVADIGCRTIQIFPGNPTGWKMGKLEESEIAKRADMIDVMDLNPLVVHSAYLINLATNNAEFLEKSKKLLDETMERAGFYRAPYVVLHTGNHGGEGVEKGINQIIESIGEGLPKWPESVKLLLENTAGSGTAIGSRFDELAEILKAFPEGKLGICIDTAHSWAAGYELGTAAGVEATMKEIESTVGLKHLHVIHVNDTKVKLGARVDRHAHIGEGNICLEGFGAVINYGWSEDFPIILETPENGTDRDRANLEKLESLVR
ncbi:MAG: deoxyribonuclease IV [Bacillota bacterium]|nr:deoxyribonuclease IV [Bacillota bacterium]